MWHRGVLYRSSPTYCLCVQGGASYIYSRRFHNLEFNTAKLRFQPVLEVWRFCTGLFHCCLRFRLRIHDLYSMEATTYNENAETKEGISFNLCAEKGHLGFMLLDMRFLVAAIASNYYGLRSCPQRYLMSAVNNSLQNFSPRVALGHRLLCHHLKRSQMYGSSPVTFTRLEPGSFRKSSKWDSGREYAITWLECTHVQ